MPFRSQAQRRYMYANHPKIAARWTREYPGQILPKRVKLKVNNKMKKGLGRMDTRTGQIEINVKAHRGDKRELASTIKHELMHVKHPKMTEKEIYKRTAKTKIDPREQAQLLSKLRDKKINYRAGAAKRTLKYKTRGSFEPGSLISKANELERVAIAGLV